ncbi:MAG TPA: hypothetical protein VFF77_04750 [Holophagaceae bacterium]|nr:hypothetical protein [Holophagaceae bacterium]
MAVFVMGASLLAGQPHHAAPDAAIQVFAAKHWRRINSLSGFPPGVRKQLGFIANPWEDADLSCAMRPGVPTRQLYFGGQSGQAFFVYYIQGMGIVASPRVVLFEPDLHGNLIQQAAWDTVGGVSTVGALMDKARTGDFAPVVTAK